jgi:hypothetical protein
MQVTINTINASVNHYQQNTTNTEEVKEVKPVELSEKTDYPVNPEKDSTVKITPDVLEKSRSESRVSSRTGGNGVEPPK